MMAKQRGCGGDCGEVVLKFETLYRNTSVFLVCKPTFDVFGQLVILSTNNSIYSYETRLASSHQKQVN